MKPTSSKLDDFRETIREIVQGSPLDIYKIEQCQGRQIKTTAHTAGARSPVINLQNKRA